MITPLDIQNKEFLKGVRGYKTEEVDAFLDIITLDLENLIQENKRLKEHIKYLTSEIDRFHKSEGAVLETLTATKSLMASISASSEKRADILLKNAEMDAARMQREARETVERINEETVTLKNRWSLFRTRYKNLLETELERFDTLSAELFSDRDFENLKLNQTEIIRRDEKLDQMINHDEEITVKLDTNTKESNKMCNDETLVSRSTRLTKESVSELEAMEKELSNI